MANANKDALYAGSLRMKIAYFVSEIFYSYKLSVTKVAHCNSKKKLAFVLSSLIVLI